MGLPLPSIPSLVTGTMPLGLQPPQWREICCRMFQLIEFVGYGSDLKESRPNGQEFDVNRPMEVEVGEEDQTLTVKNPMTSFSHRCLQHRFE